ncbi:histone-lysine N-methyltransferase SETMAR [Trichonephila clavipes]|uniref:Histone-lysine N-methyltransferase SETMAR n=1 Tax=Trichonephila clavipes TaxID=2585209 RepID=A0A8X6SSW8_TRICX|nr:histone-lysine N-methyltransferase SETMAR [Trichonephila clavipes]
MLTKGVRFHHDNARPHTANRTTALVERFGWEMVSHPPYSPDLAPSDFHLFPELKKNLGGTQFQTDEEVQNAVVNFLHGQAAEFYHSEDNARPLRFSVIKEGLEIEDSGRRDWTEGLLNGLLCKEVSTSATFIFIMGALPDPVCNQSCVTEPYRCTKSIIVDAFGALLPGYFC